MYGARTLIGLAVVAGAFAGGASAHFDDSSQYTHGSCPATGANAVDPVNLVFHGWGTSGRAVSQIESHAGWREGAGSLQFFVDHKACREAHAQRASGDGTRFHVRVRGQHHDPSLGWAAAGSAHHEDLVVFPVPCGHAVDSNGPGGSGFDQAREELLRRFREGGHDTTYVWWGNTRTFKQCDGDYAGSDGWVALIALHQENH